VEKHINIFIEGKLTNADFNFYSRVGASKYNINAIYKNGDTRHVDIEAEGNEEDIQQYINYLRNGALKIHIDLFRTEKGQFQNIQGFTSLKVHKDKNQLIKKLFGKRKQY
jgi:acylphosphatase